MFFFFQYIRKMENLSVKERLKEIIDNQPDDASYEEILKELAFERMLEKGLNNSEKDKVISNEEMEHRIKTW